MGKGRIFLCEMGKGRRSALNALLVRSPLTLLRRLSNPPPLLLPSTRSFLSFRSITPPPPPPSPKRYAVAMAPARTRRSFSVRSSQVSDAGSIDPPMMQPMENKLKRAISTMKLIKHSNVILQHEVLLEELGVYLLSFDRPGYGESDPQLKFSEKNTTLDIEELADALQLVSKFHVIGYSMGGEIVWSCLKFLPHRLAGVALLAPVANYWWPSFPANISKAALDQQLVQDQWAVRVAHYVPWLTLVEHTNLVSLFKCNNFLY